MKVSAVIAPRKIKINTPEIKSPSAIISALPIGIGICIGSLIYTLAGDSLSGEIWDFFVNFAVDFSNKNKPEIISGLIVSNLPFFIAMVIFGTCAFGTPIVFVISFIKSAGLGLLVTYIYSSFALKGIEYCLMVFFPGKILLLFAMILLTQNSYITSLDINRKLKGGDVTVDLGKYNLRVLLIYIIFILSSLVDFLTVISFSSLFDFGGLHT